MKRIHSYMLQTFLPLFVMTFAISLFIFMMQFLWQHVDDFVGKGLGIGVIAELFFYAALQMLPLALPLAILLASLITFGNLGESLELLAMKASGISLTKIMKPLMIFIIVLAVAMFFYQDHVLPWANTKSYSLLIGIKNKSPEVEIPEGTFKELNFSTDGTINTYVKSKNHQTGILYDVTIYRLMGRNVEDAEVIVADSGRLQSTADGNHMKLTLWSGEEVGNLKQSKSRSYGSNQSRHPQFRRESFSQKEFIFPFNNDLERTDESAIASRHVGKNLTELQTSVDSLDQAIDSINQVYSKQLVGQTYFRTLKSQDLQVKEDKDSTKMDKPLYTAANLDSIYASLKPQQLAEIAQKAKGKSEQVVRSFDMRKEMQMAIYKERSFHEIEMHKKFTLSFACLIFFFIGAPLGAIIKKGGLGVPIITSVVFFIIYYVIDNTGYKLARDGAWTPWSGVWLSSMVLAPIGIFLTWRALNDSNLFNWDAYRIWINRKLKRARRLFGKKRQYIKNNQ